MIQAKIIADSLNTFGDRITTMIVTMPRYILAEFNTHRMFSRNSASSRAIPFDKMISSVMTNPFIPLAYMKDHKGMQGTEYLDERDSLVCESAWLLARNKAAEQAVYLSDRGLTKQMCNRLLEPFMWHTVICTATEWENFFALRCPKYEFETRFSTTETRRSRKDVMTWKINVDKANRNIIEDLDSKDNLFWLQMNKGQADIHMMAVAEAMWDALNESIPKELKEDNWHIPFGDNIDYIKLQSELGATSSMECEELKVKIATARCARISYTVVGEEDKKDNYENDIKLHDRLATSGHWSPFEHCAKAMDNAEYLAGVRNNYFVKAAELRENGWCGNFKGFVQYRKMFNNENLK